jgi:Xaa-Pro aminopeptidase
MADRHTRLLDGLAALGCDAAVLVGTSHATHLLGYQRPHSGPTAVLLDPDGRRTLVVPIYEVEAAQQHSTADEVIGYGDGTFGLDLDPHATLAAAVGRALKGQRIGVAGDTHGAARLAGAEPVPVDDLVAAVRTIKDPDEVARVAHTQRLCLEAQDAVRDAARDGLSEIELLTLAHATIQNRAGQEIGFGGDLLVGARTALVGGPVGVAGQTRSRAGDVVLADVYAEVGGYWAATGRTSIVGELPEAEAVRDSIAALRDEVAAQLRPGLTPEAVFALVADGVRERHPDGAFAHHAGHGVGVSAYEPPFLRPGEQEPLRPGMLVTLEPGVYFTGRFGIRHENVYLITDDGAVDLRDIDEGTP